MRLGAHFGHVRYSLRERTAAGYVMTAHQLGERLLLVPGVRHEHTWFEGDAFEWDSEAETLTPVERDNDYGNLFRMLHARWRAAERTNVRAAFTTAIARPNFFRQVPYRVRDDEDLAIGNPDLKPTTSRNFDLMVERYDPRIGVLSAGLFLKRLENPIFLFTEDNTLGGETTQPRNGRSGTIRGIELAAQQQLRFLPRFRPHNVSAPGRLPRRRGEHDRRRGAHPAVVWAIPGGCVLRVALRRGRGRVLVGGHRGGGGSPRGLHGMSAAA